MTVPAVVPAIFGATKNSRVRTSMTFGSDLESGWSGTAENPSSATGWYQILLTAHPDVTQQEAEDPTWSTNYMLPAYEAAVAQVPDNLWSQNPELAAEQAVITAEQPGGAFPTSAVGPYGGEGTAVVDQDWQNTANVLTGQYKPGNDISLPPATATDTSAVTNISWWEALLQGPSGIAAYAAQQAAGAIAGSGNGASGLTTLWNFLSDPEDALERGALILFGGILIIVGLIMFARNTSTGRRVENATVGAATRGLGTNIQANVSGARADRAQRLQLSQEANRIGERKLALKEKREERLAARSNVQRPAVGKHRKT